MEVKFYPIVQDIEWKRNFGVNKGHNSSTTVQKMMCNNPNVDLVNMNAYIKSVHLFSKY